MAKKVKTTCIDVKRVAKHVPWLAKFATEKYEIATVIPDGDVVIRMVKQMHRTPQDVGGEKCARNDAFELALTDEDRLEACIE